MESPIRSLTSEQLEELCEIAEETVRDYIKSKVPWRRISDLNIAVEAGGRESLTLNVDVEVRLSPLLRHVDADALAKGAVDAAFKSAEEFLRKIRCRSREYCP
ncbi:MAG: DUF3194 domain-containing protein [Candidatus Bathyarchaeia archaeon]